MGGTDQQEKKDLQAAGKSLSLGAAIVWAVLALLEAAIQQFAGAAPMKDILFSGWVLGPIGGALIVTWGAVALVWLRDRLRGAGGRARFIVPGGIAFGLCPDPQGMQFLAFPKIESITGRNVYIRILEWELEVEGQKAARDEVLIPSPLIRLQRGQLELPAVVLPDFKGLHIGKAITGCLHLAVDFGLTKKSSSGAVYFRYMIRLPKIVTDKSMAFGTTSEIGQDEISSTRLDHLNYGTAAAIREEIRTALSAKADRT
jgi:hypothetical protein